MNISPKVWVPAAVQVIVGVALLILGYDVEGKTAIAAGLGTFAVGYQTKDPQRGQAGPLTLLIYALVCFVLVVLCVWLAERVT